MAELQLLVRIASGDRDAFVDFYERFAPRVFGFLVRLLRERGDAEDVLQDTVATLWESFDQFVPGSNFLRVGSMRHLKKVAFFSDNFSPY